MGDEHDHHVGLVDLVETRRKRRLRAGGQEVLLHPRRERGGQQGVAHRGAVGSETSAVEETNTTGFAFFSSESAMLQSPGWAGILRPDRRRGVRAVAAGPPRTRARWTRRGRSGITWDDCSSDSGPMQTDSESRGPQAVTRADGWFPRESSGERRYRSSRRCPGQGIHSWASRPSEVVGYADVHGRRAALIRDVDALRRFEADFSRTFRLSHRQALAIVDGLWAEGRALGVLPPEDPMRGIEVDIRVARILNSCSKTSSPD